MFLGFPGGSAGKESTCNTGDLDLIPESGRSPGEGKGSPLQYFGLENSMDCIVHGVAKSWTQLFHFHSSVVRTPCFHCHALGFKSLMGELRSCKLPAKKIKWGSLKYFLIIFTPQILSPALVKEENLFILYSISRNLPLSA